MPKEITSTEDISFIDSEKKPQASTEQEPVIPMPIPEQAERGEKENHQTESTKQLQQKLEVAIKRHFREPAEFFFNQLLERSELTQEVLLNYKSQIERIKPKQVKPPKSEAEKEKKKYAVKLETSNVTFADIIGFNDIKKKLRQEMVLFLDRRAEAHALGVRPAAIILYGSPGTGKSLFAQAIAGEAKIKIMAPQLNQMFNEFVGVSEKLLHDLFETAKKNAPCVVFLDEVDVLAKRRGDIAARGESAINKNMVTQLLTEMQNLHNANVPVIICGATNEIWSLDEAAVRPGRFGESIYIHPPRLKDRMGLFGYYLKEITITCKNCQHPILKEKGKYIHAKRHGHKCIGKSCEYEKCIKAGYGFNYRKISTMGFLRLAIATSAYSAADIEEICNRAKKDFLLKDYKRLTTNNVITILKTKQFRTSSLDAWYINTYKDMMGEKKETKTKLGFMKIKKEQVETEGKMNAHQKKLYREMVDDLINKHKYRSLTSFIRTIARL